MRGRVFATGALLLAASLAAGGVTAQTPIGEPPHSGGLVSRIAATRDVARCLVQHDRGVAARFVRIDQAADQASQTPAQRRAVESVKMALSNCLYPSYRSLQLSGLELRGALAESLLKDRDAALLARARAAVPVPAQRLTAATGGVAREALFGCIVGAMPGEAAAMLDADPETSGEAAAFRAFVPALQACVPAGAELHIKPANVRLWVAIALYRQAMPGAEG